jgi:DNA-binding NarL/FixJ family response regulator
MNNLLNMLKQRGLTSRESDVATLVTMGLSNKEIGNQLFIRESSVKFHLTNTYKKLNLKSRAQLIVMCLPYTEQKVESEKT